MKLVGIIPVRAGSKRFPGKNFKLYKDTTLIKNTIHKLRSAGIKEICISTDDVSNSKISAGFYNYDTIEYRERPKTSSDLLSGDDAKTENVILDVIEYLDVIKSPDIEPDYIIVLAQVTSPNWSPHRLKYAIHKLIDGSFDSVVSVSPDLKPNGCFYVFKKSTFLKYNRIYSPNMYLVRMTWEESVDIDFEYQLYLAESISKGNYDNRA